jgi:hypothetical protein
VARYAGGACGHGLGYTWEDVIGSAFDGKKLLRPLGIVLQGELAKAQRIWNQCLGLQRKRGLDDKKKEARSKFHKSGIGILE